MRSVRWLHATDSDIIDSLRAWAREHDGRGPTAAEWKREGATLQHPSVCMVCRRFGGTWNGALAS